MKSIGENDESKEEEPTPGLKTVVLIAGDPDVVTDKSEANGSEAKAQAGSMKESGTGVRESILEHQCSLKDVVEPEVSELVSKAREVAEKVGFRSPENEIRLVDASYTVFSKASGDGKAAEPANVITSSITYKLGRVLSKCLGNARNQCLKSEEGDVEMGLKTKQATAIMKNANLRFTSGKLYLVLGGPGSGKSTLLKAVAGRLKENKDNALTGQVTVNGTSRHDKVLTWNNLCVYFDQIDNNLPYLTVQETFDFAFQSKRGGTHRLSTTPKGDSKVDSFVSQLDKDDWLVMMTLEGMGLLRTKDTFVGNDHVRGVSGGERRRVTVSEMSFGLAPVLCIDELSTGLDAATTYDIVKLIRDFSKFSSSIKLLTLLQPSPETLALFDEMVLLHDGYVLYSGPVEGVVQHFVGLGYELPPRVDPADWLLALPTPKGATFFVGKGDGSQDPLSCEELAAAFSSSATGTQLDRQLKAPLPDNLSTVELRDEYTKQFRVSWYKSVYDIFLRELQVWRRDTDLIKSRMIANVIMGVILGGVFFQVKDPRGVVGILFQCLTYVMLGPQILLKAQLESRPIFYRQRKNNFFRTWTFVLGRALAGMPSTILDGLVFGTIVYAMAGLGGTGASAVGNYFIFQLVLFVVTLATSAFFAIYTAAFPDLSSAMGMGLFGTIMNYLFSGFTVQKALIPSYWIWVYWINIMAWAFRSLAVNEFRSGAYDEINPATGMTQGETILKNSGFTVGGEPCGTEWIWYGVVFNVAMWVIFMGIISYVLNKIQYTGEGRAPPPSASEDTAEPDSAMATDAMKEEEIAFPFQRVNLTFKDMRYTVTATTSGEKLELLKGISGIIEAGKMTALMGSSGAGKTTLMDVLSLRKSTGTVTGEVRVNGHLQDPVSFKRLSGYIVQFDTQTPQLTIFETVEFNAKLRIDRSGGPISTEKIKKYTSYILGLVDLTPISDLLVGTDSSGGLSFEQKKRLSIAVELVANPSVIFLDEPTSGLDALSALNVMKALKKIADSGRAVCATIHQPNQAIFNSFDSLLLLKRGGEVVFFGETGEESSLLIKYFEQYESTPRILDGENPSTWMLNVIGGGTKSLGSDGEEIDYAKSYAGSGLYQDCLSRISQLEGEKSDESRIQYGSKYATSWISQATSVTRRMFTIYFRSPSYNYVRFLLSGLLALLFGSVFVQRRTVKTEADMNSRVNTLYVLLMFTNSVFFNVAAPAFEMQRNMFYKHKAAQMYNSGALTAAVTLAEIPYNIASSTFFCVVFYFMAGYKVDAAAFFLFYLFHILDVILWVFICQVMVSIFADINTTLNYGLVVKQLDRFFAGVLLSPQEISTGLRWMYWVTPAHYVLEGWVVSQHGNDESQIVASSGSAFYKSLDCPPAGSVCTGSAEQWVDVTFGGYFTPEHTPYNIAYLVGVIALTRVLVLVFLHLFNHTKN